MKRTNRLKNFKNKIFRRPDPRAVVLMYHRVRNEAVDPWEVCVKEENFKQHLQILNESFSVIPLSMLHQGLLQKENKKKFVCITFDDGYLDNFEVAVPLLRTLGFSATFFIPAQILNGHTLFWWEAVDIIFWMQGQLPENIYLGKDKNIFSRIIRQDDYQQDTRYEYHWSANTMPPSTKRCSLYLELCAWVKERTPEEQSLITEQLLSYSKNRLTFENSFKKMTNDQIRFLITHGFEIGAHSVHHPALSHQCDKVQRDEIEKSKWEIEGLMGKPVTAFAYPHGNFNEQTKMIVKNAGFKQAFTTENGSVGINKDWYSLPRLWVKNWNGDEFKHQLTHLFNN